MSDLCYLEVECVEIIDLPECKDPGEGKEEVEAENEKIVSE